MLKGAQMAEAAKCATSRPLMAQSHEAKFLRVALAGARPRQADHHCSVTAEGVLAHGPAFAWAPQPRGRRTSRWGEGWSCLDLAPRHSSAPRKSVERAPVSE